VHTILAESDPACFDSQLIVLFANALCTSFCYPVLVELGACIHINFFLNLS